MKLETYTILFPGNQRGIVACKDATEARHLFAVSIAYFDAYAAPIKIAADRKFALKHPGVAYISHIADAEPDWQVMEWKGK